MKTRTEPNIWTASPIRSRIAPKYLLQFPANVETPMPLGTETSEDTEPIVALNAGRMTQDQTKYGLPPQI